MMIEQIILDHLKRELPVPVYLSEPSQESGADPPSKYVLFEKTGSGRINRLNSSTFAFQSYGESLFEAASLNEQAKLAVDSLINLDEISRVSLNSDYNFTDTTTKRYRYQAVYDIAHY